MSARGTFVAWWLACALGLGAGAAGAQPVSASQRRTARVTDVTRTTVYLDAGRRDGLTEGARWQVTVEGRSVEARVVALANASSTVALEGHPSVRIGSTLALPGERTPPAVERVTRRDAPAPPPPWQDSLASSAVPRVGRNGRVLEPEGVDVDGRRTGVYARGEVALRLLLMGSPEGLSRGYQDVGVVSQLEAGLGRGWRWDHLIEARLAGSPETFWMPFQNATPRLDVYLFRLGYLSPGARFGAELGRLPAAPGTSLGMVDGGRARLFVTRGLELTAFGGLRPNHADLGLEFSAPRGGLGARWRVGRAAGTGATVDLAFAVDGWNGGIDRAFGLAGARVRLGTALDLGGEVVLDVAADADGRDGPRVTRGLADARVRLWGGRVRFDAMGGYDQPVYTPSVVAQVPGAYRIPARMFGMLSGEALLAGRLAVLALGRTSVDEDGLASTTGEVGFRVLSLGPAGSFAAVRARVVQGELADGVGGSAHYDLTIPSIVRVELGWSTDRWTLGPNQQVSWWHRGRIALDRRFGTRWRTSLAYEAATDGTASQHLVFLLVGYRIGT